MAREVERRIGGGTIRLVLGDITKESTDAVANAANSTLLGGGGVDGAIHRAGGPEILAACQEVRAKQGGCPTGEAVITPGGRLPARYVIHAVGPVWGGGDRGEPDLLASCYRNSLKLAAAHGIRSIAFPSISTGIYGYPVEEAAKVALSVVASFLTAGNRLPDYIRFVLFDEATFAAYEKALLDLAP